MSTERKIHGRFLVAEMEAVENALRRGIWSALLSHQQAEGFLATWEGGRVVLVPARKVYSLKPRPGRESFGDVIFSRQYQRSMLFRNVRRVYVKDETFYVVFENEKHDPFLDRPPDGFRLKLRELCRELTGRDLNIRVVEEGAAEGKDLLLELPKPTPGAEVTARESASIPRLIGLHGPGSDRRETPPGSNPGEAAKDAPSRGES